MIAAVGIKRLGLVALALAAVGICVLVILPFLMPADVRELYRRIESRPSTVALGGIARVGQVQLLQPFITLGASAVMLGESITPATIAVALVVALIVALGRKAAVQRPKQPAIVANS